MKSEFKFWRWAAVIGVLILGIVGSIAVAAPKGGGGGSELQQLGRQPRGADGIRFERRGPGRHLSDLAKGSASRPPSCARRSRPSTTTSDRPSPANGQGPARPTSKSATRS